MSQSQALELRDVAQTTVAQLRDPDFEEQVGLALPENISPQKFLRAAATAVLEEPKLAAPALRASLARSVLKASQDGLLPDGREAALVIFGSEVVYMPMVSGFRKIAAEHGWTMWGAVVYENDDFREERGDTVRIVHHPVRPGAERGDPIAAYACARHLDGRLLTKVMDAAEIDRVKQTSRGKGGDLWTKWWDRAWQKTVTRALFKDLPLDPADKRIESVIAASNGADPIDAMYGPGAPPALEPAARQTPGEPSSGGAAEPALAVEGEVVNDELEAAGATVVPDRFENGTAIGAAGFTLAQVAENAEGRAWLRWAGAALENFPEEFRAPLATFVRLAEIA